MGGSDGSEMGQTIDVRDEVNKGFSRKVEGGHLSVLDSYIPLL